MSQQPPPRSGDALRGESTLSRPGMRTQPHRRRGRRDHRHRRHEEDQRGESDGRDRGDEEDEGAGDSLFSSPQTALLRAPPAAVSPYASPLPTRAFRVSPPRGGCSPSIASRSRSGSGAPHQAAAAGPHGFASRLAAGPAPQERYQGRGRGTPPASVLVAPTGAEPYASQGQPQYLALVGCDDTRAVAGAGSSGYQSPMSFTSSAASWQLASRPPSRHGVGEAHAALRPMTPGHATYPPVTRSGYASPAPPWEPPLRTVATPSAPLGAVGPGAEACSTSLLSSLSTVLSRFLPVGSTKRVANCPIQSAWQCVKPRCEAAAAAIATSVRRAPPHLGWDGPAEAAPVAPETSTATAGAESLSCFSLAACASARRVSDRRRSDSGGAAALESGARYPDARFGHTAVVLRGHMYVFGGRNTTYHNDVWQYSLRQPSWAVLDTVPALVGGARDARPGDLPGVQAGPAAPDDAASAFEPGEYFLNVLPLPPTSPPAAVAAAAEAPRAGGASRDDAATLPLVPCRPVPRAGHTAVLARHEMIILGGSTTERTSIDDMWSLNLDTLEWTLLTRSTPIGARKGHTANLFFPTGHRHAAAADGEAPPLADFSCATPSSPFHDRFYSALDACIPPGEHVAIQSLPCVAAVQRGGVDGGTAATPAPGWRSAGDSPSPPRASDPLGSASERGMFAHEMLQSCGCSGASLSEPLHAWRLMTPPPTRERTAFMVVYGGKVERADDSVAGGPSGAADDAEDGGGGVFVYHVASNRWGRLLTSGETPPNRFYHVAEVTHRLTLLVFGGRAVVPPAGRGAGAGGGAAVPHCFLNDLHELDLYTGVWSRLHGLGDVPSPRMCCASLYLNGTLVILAGGAESYLKDDYEYDVDSNQWHRLALTGRIPCTRPTVVRHGYKLTQFGGCSEFHECCGKTIELRLEPPSLAEGCLQWMCARHLQRERQRAHEEWLARAPRHHAPGGVPLHQVPPPQGPPAARQAMGQSRGTVGAGPPSAPPWYDTRPPPPRRAFQ